MTTRWGDTSPGAQMLMVVVASNLAAAALGCSTFNYVSVSKTGAKYVASGRTLDFLDSPGTSLTWVPAGLNAELAYVNGSQYSSLGQTYRVKYPFVCMQAMRNIVVEASHRVYNNSSILSPSSWPGGCTDGMNTKGLAVSLLWQRDTKSWPNYTKPGTPAVMQMDFVAYVLASYANVYEVKAALKAGLQIVTNPSMGPTIQETCGTPFMPAHFSVMDSKGNSLVLEMDNNTLMVHNNTLGVMTNAPFYPKQVQMYKSWEANVTRPPLNFTTINNSTFYLLPGSHSSPHRFTRLAMLKKTAATMQFPKANPLIPGSVVAHPKGGNAVIMTVMDILQTVYLPRGMDDMGGWLPPGSPPMLSDWTIWAAVRDQTAMAYYYRVADTPQWSVIKLKSVTWPKHVETVPLDSFVWWRDNTNGFRKKKPATLRQHL